MTSEIALHCMKSESELKSELCEECPIYGQTGSDHCFEDALQYVIGMLEQSNADGCRDCAFEDVEEWEMPCSKCKRSYKDYWRRKAESEG